MLYQQCVCRVKPCRTALWITWRCMFYRNMKSQSVTICPTRWHVDLLKTQEIVSRSGGWIEMEQENPWLVPVIASWTSCVSSGEKRTFKKNIIYIYNTVYIGKKSPDTMQENAIPVEFYSHLWGLPLTWEMQTSPCTPGLPSSQAVSRVPVSALSSWMNEASWKKSKGRQLI